MFGRDALEVLFWRVGRDTAEEDADLRPPPSQIFTQHLGALFYGELHRAKGFGVPAEEELPSTGNTYVANPVGLAARCNEITRPVVAKGSPRV